MNNDGKTAIFFIGAIILVVMLLFSTALFNWPPLQATPTPEATEIALINSPTVSLEGSSSPTTTPTMIAPSYTPTQLPTAEPTSTSTSTSTPTATHTSTPTLTPTNTPVPASPTATLTPQPPPLTFSVDKLSSNVFVVTWNWSSVLDWDMYFAVRFWPVDHPEQKHSLTWTTTTRYDFSVNNDQFPPGDYHLNVAVIRDLNPGDGGGDDGLWESIIESDAKLVNVPHLVEPPALPTPPNIN